MYRQCHGLRAPRGAELPEDQVAFVEINADLAGKWPNITEKKDPLPDAEEWDGKPDKLQYMER